MSDMRQWFVPGQLEVREGRSGEPTWLVGYAAVFNQEATIKEQGARWRERIMPTAFDAVLESADVIAAVNHDPKLVLGRSRAGSLKLSVDRVGLRYEVKLPNTSLARDTIENVRNGNYPGSSFKFDVSRNGIRVEKPRHVDDLPLILIDSVSDLADVGPVTFPAYKATSVGLRSENIAEMLAQHDVCVRALKDADIDERERWRLRIQLARAS